MLEVGVNGGHSAFLALTSEPGLEYHGVDICEYAYVKPAVAWLQVCLAVRAGHAGLSIDGGYGPATRAAVTAFQTQASLPPTGDADGPTCAALAALPVVYATAA